MSIVFRLPDLGEGLTESEIVSWKVAEGDQVALNQVIAEVETAKAVVDLPSPYAGTIRRLHAAEGDTVEVGAPLVEYELAPPGPDPAAPAAAPASETREHEDEPDTAHQPEPQPEPERVPVLVGSVAVGGATRAARAPRTFAQTPFVREERAAARAYPPVRRLAKERGIDLAAVVATGEGGVVTRSDLDRAVRAPAAAPGPRREKATGLRRQTAKTMTAALTVPQAACFLQVDVTETLRLVHDLADEQGAPTLLSLVARAVVLAVPRTPGVNAAYLPETDEIEFRPTVNLGIAVAADRGLLVASVDDAGRLDAGSLAAAIARCAAEARAGTIGMAALTSATLTLSNVGVFGVDGGIPLLAPGQSAIIALGAVRRMPWEHEGGVALRDVLTVTVTFDHRVVDGREASGFLRDVGRMLERPGLALARG
ncbi:dihydrolipoamide acetyltransferase family protein [Microbacterium gilvum]|uniref:Dihydrolipoamide acetyltransferase component of pyruvate dehydrogenase complex n=1 Tax=Microbacterium gilvum TaxID=1336204 RepID=A0ABP9ASD9_9MICO